MHVLARTQKRQIYYTTGLALCHCLRRFSISELRIVMIKLRIAALANARQPGFLALIFSDVKTPNGNSAAYKQAAADDLSQMGLVARTEDILYSKPTGRSSERTTMAVVAQINDDADRWALWCHGAARRQREGQGSAPPV